MQACVRQYSSVMTGRIEAETRSLPTFCYPSDTLETGKKRKENIYGHFAINKMINFLFCCGLDFLSALLLCQERKSVTAFFLDWLTKELFLSCMPFPDDITIGPMLDPSLVRTFFGFNCPIEKVRGALGVIQSQLNKAKRILYTVDVCTQLCPFLPIFLSHFVAP